ncbi:hypothetical protein VU02_02705 [Desulfobulbus sp. N2]|nr:hypothetical protein [Desulfobulbus sp. N2]
MKNDYLLAALLLLTTFLAVPPALADNNTRREDKFLKEWYIEDEQVETATRSPKPMAQVAENVTIVTAEEIEAMHAHTLAEILSWQSGVFGFFWPGFLWRFNNSSFRIPATSCLIAP